MSIRQPGRSSLVARIEGSDPNAPSLLLMGHTDVVPVNPDGWSRDPFGAEIVDGFIWGRGAVDMLNLTASQAVAFRMRRAPSQAVLGSVRASSRRAGGRIVATVSSSVARPVGVRVQLQIHAICARTQP